MRRPGSAGLATSLVLRERVCLTALRCDTIQPCDAADGKIWSASTQSQELNMDAICRPCPASASAANAPCLAAQLHNLISIAMVAHAPSLHSGPNASAHIPTSVSSISRPQLPVHRLPSGRPAASVPSASRQDSVALAALGGDAEGAGPQGRPPDAGSSWNVAASRASEGEPQLVRVRLCVNYRVHSRQMLCIGGSQIPFGWSFLSIAKVPMVWTEGDLWTAEVGK